MIAVIAGSTGLTGALLLSKLLKDQAITKVIAVTRRPLDFTHTKLKNILVSDFADLMNRKEEMKGELYFCCLGTTIKIAGTQENFRKVDFDAVVNFGRLAEYHKSQSLVVISAAGANPHSSIFYNKVKGEAEEALLKLSLNHLILLRPGLLIGERKAHRPLEKATIKLTQVLSSILPERIEKSFATTIEALSERMLKEGKNTANKIKIINAVDI